MFQLLSAASLNSGRSQSVVLGNGLSQCIYACKFLLAFLLQNSHNIFSKQLTTYITCVRGYRQKSQERTLPDSRVA